MAHATTKKGKENRSHAASNLGKSLLWRSKFGCTISAASVYGASSLGSKSQVCG